MRPTVCARVSLRRISRPLSARAFRCTATCTGRCWTTTNGWTASGRNSVCTKSIAPQLSGVRVPPSKPSAMPARGSSLHDSSPRNLRVLYVPRRRLTARLAIMNARKEDARMLLADLHIHTTWSDGRLSMAEVVDLFGRSGHDVIAITDHIVNRDNLLGKVTHRFGLTLTKENFGAYRAEIEAEAKRAWDEYRMIVIAGAELTQN